MHNVSWILYFKMPYTLKKKKKPAQWHLNPSKIGMVMSANVKKLLSGRLGVDTKIFFT